MVVSSACSSTASTPGPVSEQAEPSSAAVAEAVSEESATTGNTEDGKVLFVSKACAGCHTVEGFPEAQGKVGPELSRWESDSLIAGILPSSDENLREWLKDPPALKSGTLMPNQNLTGSEIDALIAFLRTLK